MAATRRLTPRKSPSQRRSQATFERIIETATRILLRDGYGAATTTRIAAEAGISPGSLYQYFPNRDAIVLAVADRLFERAADVVMRSFLNSFERPLAETVPAVLSGLFEALDGQRELVRAVVEELPPHEGRPRIAEFERRVTDVGRAYLGTHRDELQHPDTEIAAWIVVRSVSQLVLRYILDGPPVPRAVYAEELTRLVMSYLESDVRG